MNLAEAKRLRVGGLIHYSGEPMRVKAIRVLASRPDLVEIRTTSGVFTERDFEHLTGKRTVRFYTDSGLYKGWEYLNSVNYRIDVVGWIRSGNYVMVKHFQGADVKIDNVNKTLFHRNRYFASLIK